MSRNQPTDRDGNAVRHGTRDRLNRIEKRLSQVQNDGATNPHVTIAQLIGVTKALIDLLRDEL